MCVYLRERDKKKRERERENRDKERGSEKKTEFYVQRTYEQIHPNYRLSALQTK